MNSSNDLELLLLTLVIFAGSISTVGFPMEFVQLDLDHDHDNLDRLMFGRGFFDGSLTVDPADLHQASVDFGGLTPLPSQGKIMAVLRPGSVNDVVKMVKTAYVSRRGFAVSARGHGHSTNGQARPYSAPGVVIEMSNYNDHETVMMMIMKPNVVIDGGDRGSYVDVWGGELWIDVLKASLEYGLAPKSWTDYLYLSVGGTLSNGGISGQAFNHGPQIANVHELEVVTGKGELLTCSEEQNTDLFHGVLGGLGQFGIITRARIALEPAPQRVRWIRVLYSNFHDFTKDQEYLISLHGKPNRERFDYVEGFVIVDEGLINNWRSSFFSPRNPIKFTSVGANGGVIYSLEITRNYDESTSRVVDQEVEALLKKLNYIPSSVFTSDLPYVDFLDRVRKAELKLRSKGLWEVPHPWLNLFVPKSRIVDFNKGVFKGILGNKTSGPILIYPMNKNKWDHRDSVVTPDEEVFYVVALLRSALDSGDETQSLEYLTNQNRRILNFCDEAGIKVKQYLPHHSTEEEWKGHFGEINWDRFVKRKMQYDPRRILATGQRIFAPQFDSRASSSL